MSVKQASIHITCLSHATVLEDLINYVLNLFINAFLWCRNHSSDWDQIFQRNRENKSHARRSININPWLVYFLFWNIHSCFCHFQKSRTNFPVKKLPSHILTRRSLKILLPSFPILFDEHLPLGLYFLHSPRLVPNRPLPYNSVSCLGLVNKTYIITFWNFAAAVPVNGFITLP